MYSMPITQAMLDLFPASLAEIARIIGPQGALRLVELYGGRRLYIPERIDATHALARELGLEAAEALGATYAGERIEIPLARQWCAAIRAKAVAEARAAGHSQAQVAEQFGICERTVRSFVARAKEESAQVSLFDG